MSADFPAFQRGFTTALIWVATVTDDYASSPWPSGPADDAVAHALTVIDPGELHAAHSLARECWDAICAVAPDRAELMADAEQVGHTAALSASGSGVGFRDDPALHGVTEKLAEAVDDALRYRAEQVCLLWPEDFPGVEGSA